VRAGLEDDTSGSTATRTPTTLSTTAGTTTTRTPRPKPKRTFYVIKRGDTLEIVADKYGTTVEALVELNPGIDPVALTVGQRIRVQ
jgi:LysM repeat protein